MVMRAKTTLQVKVSANHKLSFPTANTLRGLHGDEADAGWKGATGRSDRQGHSRGLRLHQRSNRFSE
jgi:hypothetical protein